MKKQTVFVLVLLVTIMCYAALAIERYNYRKSWEAKTSPLPQKTISALCKSFSLSSEHHLCNDSRSVYAYDFTDVLYEYFSQKSSSNFSRGDVPKDKATITYQDVDDVIGAYKTGCQEVVNQREFSYFRCFYDFQGDDYWRTAFYFYYPENTLFSIRSSSSDDS